MSRSSYVPTIIVRQQTSSLGTLLTYYSHRRERCTARCSPCFLLRERHSSRMGKQTGSSELYLSASTSKALSFTRIKSDAIRRTNLLHYLEAWTISKSCGSFTYLCYQFVDLTIALGVWCRSSIKEASAREGAHPHHHPRSRSPWDPQNHTRACVA